MGVCLNTATGRQIYTPQAASYMVKGFLESKEYGCGIMVKETMPSLSFFAFIFIPWLTVLLLQESKVEAALNADEILVTSEQIPVDNLTRKNPIDLREPQGWEKKLLKETFSQNHFQKSQLPSQSRPLLHLKSAGKLPGIEFGIEMHSI
jgi:hypothetical protein